MCGNGYWLAPRLQDGTHRSLTKKQTGMTMMHVPYKGIPQMTQSILQGETDLGWLGVFTAKPLIESGKLLPFAYVGKTRSKLLPQVPTFAESGLPEVGISVWYGLLAPARTPPGVLDQIDRDVRKVLADPAFIEANMAPKGYEPANLSRGAFADHIKKEFESRRTLVQISGVQAE